ncbi:ATP-dependent RNA helicase dbp-10, putative [Perkinsus marinus ATCC 50983]|uniref:RNA helicase n=1 Tax=Perkinsus marinus (strain ATCC 50983 / TXsc) TaxID=423536 RepID=C5L2W2_PERM5|nr:ATP-dependent RNA helicase dbp-10, putative [Perkinsus marinus ATCC 50983]EER08935.1 ATP-dependent RNA helicase dbp-10, putative [Perkinsus marinus ATCC 50983]|eukprot:XP_002777119.1 ATP-dependent RNA helicase dbp-10, putative [Perkinsus marinus ATCC 50983]
MVLEGAAKGRDVGHTTTTTATSSGGKKISGGAFQTMGLSDPLFKAIQKMGYNQPTPIQRKAIPAILGGSDVVAMARTGSGKTAAFVIPMIQILKGHSEVVGARAVILSPTRELAMQTIKVTRMLGKFTDLRLCLIVGGHSMESQFDRLSSNPDVLICTPGRLVHHMVEADLSLQRVQYIVFDEADRLFEMGFADDMQSILKATPPSRQCLLFSATLPSQLTQFSRAGLRSESTEFIRLDVEHTISDTLDLWFLYTTADSKPAALVALLRKLQSMGNKSTGDATGVAGVEGKSKGGKKGARSSKTIVFVATRHNVEFFASLLTQVGISNAPIYGSMDQTQRTSSLSKFRSGKASVLLVTDVAARGIDIPQLDYVINYDFPSSSKLFVHRCGRTARAGAKGLCASLVTHDDMPYAVELMLFLGRKLGLQALGSDHPIPAEGDGDDGEVDEKRLCVIGGIPSVQEEVETVRRLVSGDAELASLQRSMMSAYHLYYKTRPAASNQSVRRAKLILRAEAGGPQRLLDTPHPAFRTAADLGSQSVEDMKEKLDMIAQLRSFRPSQQPKSTGTSSTTAIKPETMAEISQHVVAPRKLRHDLKRMSRVRQQQEHQQLESQEQEDEDSDVEESVTGEGEMEDVQVGQKRPLASSQRAATDDKRTHRMLSKRARRKLEKNGGSLPQPNEAGLAVGGRKKTSYHLEDGVSVFNQTTCRSNQFYLGSVDADQSIEAKEREKQLDIEKAQLDLVPDDRESMTKAKSVMRWDARKKKYLPVMVAGDGGAPIAASRKRRNEAGKLVSGEMEKSDIYSKWLKSSHKRIQKVGELEDKQNNTAFTAPRKAITIEDDNEEDRGTGSGGGARMVKEFHGGVQKEFLTNKQKRHLAKQDRVMGRVGVTSRGDNAKDELLHASQIAKNRKKKTMTKIMQDPKRRKAFAAKSKAAFRAKQAEKLAHRGAPRRSFAIGDNSGGKGRGRRR